MQFQHRFISRSLRQQRQDNLHRQPLPSDNGRAVIEGYRRRQRPFRLTYQDAAERIWSFTIRHAIICTHEDRQYLDCWCDETTGNQDILALQHNWCLRLDRIPEEAVISPVPGPWHPELDTIEVEIHLLNRLALAYRPKSDGDQVNEWDGERQVRRVIRRIHNTFWFFREVRRDGPDCIVIGPEEVRQRFRQELQHMLAQYPELL